MTEPERVELAARSMKVEKQSIKVLAKTAFFEVFAAEVIDKKLLGLLRSKHQSLRTLDEKGIVRLQTRNGVVRQTNAAEADKAIVDLAQEHSHYGDAGRIVPNIMLLAGPRIVDLSGMAEPEQIAALARTELSTLPPDTPTIVIAGLP